MTDLEAIELAIRNTAEYIRKSQREGSDYHEMFVYLANEIKRAIEKKNAS